MGPIFLFYTYSCFFFSTCIRLSEPNMFFQQFVQIFFLPSLTPALLLKTLFRAAVCAITRPADEVCVL